MVALLVFGSVSLGLRIPGEGVPRSSNVLAPPDYSRGLLGAVAPLRTSYIANVLGSAIQPPAGPEAQLPFAFRGGSPGSALRGAAPIVEHPLTNDDFEDAYAVPTTSFTARTNTTGAARQPGEPSNCSRLGNTIWYRLVAPSDLGLIVDTYGTDRATSLAVFTGSSLANLHQQGCSTDPQGNARVAFPGNGGTTYYFQVAPLTDGPTVFSVRLEGLTTGFPGAQPASLVSPVVFAPSPDGRYLEYVALAVGTPTPAGPMPSCVGIIAYIRVAPDTVCRPQAFLYDRVTQKTVLVSDAPDGAPANDFSVPVGISADGRWVPFNSFATNLTDGHTDNGHPCVRTQPFVSIPPGLGLGSPAGSCYHMYVHDRDADGNGVFDEPFRGADRNIQVDVASDGTPANAGAGPGWMSPDGRYVVFQSWASNLVDDDTNGVGDVFAHDRDADGNGVFDETFPGAQRTWRVSVSSSGAQTVIDRLRATEIGSCRTVRDRRDYTCVPVERGNHILGESFNGHYVMFRSPATNLDPRCTNGGYQVYVHDIFAGWTTCVSVNARGESANRSTRHHNSFAPKISDDGRFAIFNSDATNLVPGDTNGAEDLFVRDLVRGTTERVSVGWDGSQATGEDKAEFRDAMFGAPGATGVILGFDDIYTLSELNHMITADGRYVFFSSGADNLVPGDGNHTRDVFVRDLWREVTTMVSVSTSGRQGDEASNAPIATSDGGLVCFWSLSTNLDDQHSHTRDLGLVPIGYLRVLPEEP